MDEKNMRKMINESNDPVLIFMNALLQDVRLHEENAVTTEEKTVAKSKRAMFETLVTKMETSIILSKHGVDKRIITHRAEAIEEHAKKIKEYFFITGHVIEASALEKAMQKVQAIIDTGVSAMLDKGYLGEEDLND